LTKKDKFRV